MAEDWRKSMQETRERQELSRAQLARLASLSVDTIRAYEQGRRRPSSGSLTATRRSRPPKVNKHT